MAVAQETLLKVDNLKGYVVATRWNSSAPSVSSPPSTSSGRLPNRSDAQPTTGRSARACALSAMDILTLQLGAPPFRVAPASAMDTAACLIPE